MKQKLNFTSDAKRFAWMRKHLYVPVVCDVLDSLGCRDRAMHQRLRPLDPENCVIIGRARTFRWMDADYVDKKDPYGLEIAAMCICDSNIRDCRKIVAMEFPVFFAGIRPLDSMGRGRVMAYDVPVRCGDVLVQPGELVFADFDGVVVVPRALEDEALARAHEKVTKENHSRRDLLRGDTLRA